MNRNRSDASTSTDDVKGRPLCLFYFTHPFGVLSPEPPTLAAAPPDIARAFINMEPVSPFHFWSSTSTEESYKSTSSVSTRPSYDLGNATVHRSPVNVVSVANTRKCTLELGSRRDSLASTLFSSEIWFNSTSSSRSNERARRMVPYNAILPPLQLPSNLSELDSPDDVWPRKCPVPGKFSLPPIEMPCPKTKSGDEEVAESAGMRAESVSTVRETRARRRLGVTKPRRRRSDVRRLLACLMRRAIRGGERHPSPALQRLLATIRDAWAEPTSLFYRCATLCRAPRRPPSPRAPHMLQRVQLAELPPRPDASPGLLRRRYSVPETIMRKYRVAQQRAECEESEPPSRGSAASLSPGGRGACSPCAGPRFARDRELMRKSALLRRMWGRAPPPCCCCCRAELAPRHARSLDGSHSELRSRSRAGDPPAALSVSTYQSHARGASSCIDTVTDAYTDTDAWRSDERVVSPPGERFSAAATADVESLPSRLHAPARDRRALSPPSSTIPAAASNRGVCASLGNEDGEKRPREVSQRPLADDAPTSCEMLEIVVSEVLDSRGAPEHEAEAPGAARARAPAARLGASDVDIDEYVSSVLVESLNSLTDRLECVTSSVGNNRKISVVEKEIKVKLQSTGVNTIVHLSPTSNNQIIFGNEELCDGGAAGAGDAGMEAGERDACNNRRDTLVIRDEPLEDQRNNNLAAPRSPGDRLRITEFDGGGAQSDSVNRAVLQQIQKLFQDGLEPDGTCCSNSIPGISHIEISNVDVYIDNNTQPAAPAHSDEPAATQAIGAVGTGNYYEDADDTVVVPRFSAFPHTDSMEVNTSSSDDAEMIGSDCTSLVDSLDDPNSPRSVMLRRSFGSRRGERELVRSAIDVLDLLPESSAADRDPPKDKPEAFFIRIEDDRCECDKENLNVADRMPEKIKQRLYRRHRRRQLRMECARRTKLKQMKRDADRQRLEDARARRLLERDCAAIIHALIDDVIAKIAQDEYKVARIKRRPDRPSPANTDENHTKKNRKKESRSPGDDNPDRIAKREAEQPRAPRAAREPEPALETHHVRGKLSLVPRSTLPADDACPRRLYQKSEIHEGNKCIEILEILEYVNGAHSSPETPSDESPGQQARSGKRSRIPVPVHEKTNRQNKTKPTPGDDRVSPLLSRENRNFCDTNANVPCDNTGQTRATADDEPPTLGGSPAARRASVPPASEPRPRSDSLRFRRIFDIIPEERSSLSVDSSPDDGERRRLSAGFGRAAPAPAPAPTPPPAPATRSVATSPLADVDCRVGKCPAPAGGPLRVKGGEGGEGGARERGRHARVWPALRRNEGSREKVDRAIRRTERRVSDAGVATGAGDLTADPERARVLQAKQERHVNRSKSESRERHAVDALTPTRSYNGVRFDNKDRRDGRELYDKKSDEESSRGLGRPSASPTEGEGSSSSGESGGSLLCPLAPRWLAGNARRRRRRADRDPPGGWSVTVAGSCRAALPADVEMRLRFPRPPPAAPPAHPAHPAPHAHLQQECRCRCWAECACSAPPERAAAPPLPAAHPAHLARADPKLTLTLKKEARDSSVLASKSTRRSTEPLPDLETYSSSRTKTKSSMKTRRGYSLHCWLPEDEPAPIRASNGLSVLGCAIIPELKPRAPTMSERDLTRLYTPRHYLRS